MNHRHAIAAALIGLAAAFGASAQDAGSPAAKGYDYAPKFYPHPAWLYLSSEAPRERSDHPAVIVARNARAAEREAARVELAASFAPHN